MNFPQRFFLIFILFESLVWAVSVPSNAEIIHWNALGKAHGAVVFVYNKEDFYSLKLVKQMARQLAAYGWSTVLFSRGHDNASDWVAQLPKIIRFLRKKNFNKIVLIHYGDNLSDLLTYFNKPQAKKVNGLILLSAYDNHLIFKPFPRLYFPVFDVAGQFDYGVVLNQSMERAVQLNRNHYRFIKVPGAYHDYKYHEKLLLAFVHGWMSQLPAVESYKPPI